MAHPAGPVACWRPHSLTETGDGVTIVGDRVTSDAATFGSEL